MDYLKQNKFELISVPDLVPTNLVEGCGMNPHGDRNQVIFQFIKTNTTIYSDFPSFSKKDL